jgi:superfamily I DNA and/or RNA helicase
MKKVLTLIIFSLLLQSCSSYTRAINFKNGAGGFIINENVKITKNNGTTIFGNVLSTDEKQIQLLSREGNQLLKIQVKNINGVQGKEFSVVKSASIIIVPLSILFIIMASALNSLP